MKVLSIVHAVLSAAKNQFDPVKLSRQTLRSAQGDKPTVEGNPRKSLEARDRSVGGPFSAVGVCMLLVTGAFFVTPEFASAAFEYSRASTASYALGGAIRLLDSSPLDLAENPALSCSTQFSGAIVATRLFGMPDFDLGVVGGQYNRDRWSIGVAGSYLGGSEYYRERSYLMAASASFAKRWRIGAAVDHQRIEFGEGYRGEAASFVSLGALLQLKKGAVGIGVANVLKSRWRDDTERMPITATASLSWCVAKDLNVHATHRFDPDLPDRFAIGQEWRVAKALRLLLGLTSNPTDVSGGIILTQSRFEFEYAYRQNVYLGGSHRLGMRWSR